MKNITHVTEKNNPELPWLASPPGFSMPHEFYRSDAFTVLTKSEIIVLMWVLSRRVYASGRKRKKGKGKYNTWRPENLLSVKLPYKGFQNYYTRQQRSKRKPLSERVFYRSLNKLMAVGFISLVKLGGNGVGDMSVYRYEFAWRLWREGDDPCFTKEGHSNSKGFVRRAKNGEFAKGIKPW